jgi:hypothetical protein
MKIASQRTLDDMDSAAELRVQGATWDTIAQVLGRHKRVLTRWVRYYPEDWERLFNEAKQRLANELGGERG